ncbi:agmatine deiminase family protein [Marinoscillum sp.]|uniref:agmatine deiminase family protein n=1 Tax=Marinoscillum sp. TaxID=2024838 RepID=UPI003BAA9C11
MKISQLVTALLLLSCTNNNPTDSWTVTRQPAEYEELDAIWLIWPPTEHKSGESVQKVTISVIEALIDDLNIIVTCGDKDLCDEARKILNSRFKESQNLTIREVPSVEIWARDTGPTFVETSDGKHAIADFNFNAWGYTDTLDVDTKTEELYDTRVADLLQIPVISSSMISEGGNREVNGRGTLMVAERVEQGRNPHLSRSQMEAEYKRLLGVEKVIWLKRGLQEDDHTFLGPLNTAEGTKAYTVVTTNGHIDEFARFVNDSTILLAQVDSSAFDDPMALENHQRLEENYQILLEETDQNGNPFNIIRMPLPETVFDKMAPGDYVYDYIKTQDYQDGTTFPDGDTITVVAAASYLNFLITNTVVIGQKYWREGMADEINLKDERAKRVLESIFPDRKIIMLDARAVNLGGGGIHCFSMQQPKLKPKG